MNAKRYNIFFVAQDMGGCNALLPVFLRLKNNRSYRVSALFGPVFKKYIAPHLARYVSTGADPDAIIEKHLSSFHPYIIVVGIGIGKTLDKSAVAWAKKHGVTTVGVVESWGDTVGGFSSPGTRDLARAPDHICVVDDFLKRRMKKEGFNPSCLFVTGNPHFDTFRSPMKKYHGKKAIYFFCQPFSELPHLKTGLNEVDVFRDLVHALEALHVILPVVIRFHPRTKDHHKFDDIITWSSLHISIDRSKVMETALARSELVLGMFGAALFEAALMGKKVLSYLPTLTIHDPLMSNRIGLSVPVYRKKDLIPKMKKLIENTYDKKSLSAVHKKYIHGHATDNVFRCIQSVL
ncbi:MAG: hypothetical protein ABIB04_05395 [Patescibacteria group bacterium]